MVVTDHFTRYAQAYITLKQTVPVVAKTLWDQFLVHYGWPTKILTDQGKSFENQLIRELCSLAKVQTLWTTPYRLQTNGSCEHFNYTLMSMLGTLPIHAKKNWPEWVSTLTHAYNATMCRATRFSSFFLMYGRIPILPIDVEFGVMIPDITHASHQNYTEKLKACLKWAYKVARENSDREAARHKQFYDQKFKCMKIVPGDLVLVRVKAFGPDHKMLIDGNKFHTKYCHNTTIHQCTKNSQLMKVRKKMCIHCTGTCCSHYNQSRRMKLLAKMKHWCKQIWP